MFQITLCTTFRLSGEDIFSQVSSLPYFLPPNHFYPPPASPTTKMFSFGRHQGSFGVVPLRTLFRTHFLAEHRTLCSRLLPLLWKELPWLDRFFLAQKELRSFLRILEEPRHVTVPGLQLVQTLRPVPGWITLQLSFETLNRCALPSLFLPAGLALPAFLHFSFLLILQKSTDDAQGEF